MNRAALVVKGIGAAADFVDRLKILSSVISFGRKSLVEYIVEKNNEIDMLKEVKSLKEQKLVDIQVDNVRLNMEIEAYSLEIKRLSTLIKEN